MSKLTYIGWLIFIGGVLNISKYPSESAEWVGSIVFIIVGIALFSYGNKLSDYICKLARSKPTMKSRRSDIKINRTNTKKEKSFKEENIELIKKALKFGAIAGVVAGTIIGIISGLTFDVWWSIISGIETGGMVMVLMTGMGIFFAYVQYGSEKLQEYPEKEAKKIERKAIE